MQQETCGIRFLRSPDFPNALSQIGIEFTDMQPVAKNSVSWSIAATTDAEHRWPPLWYRVVALLVWLVAAGAVFLPFAVGTSPFDAVTLRVPGNQGNWWHALIGAPFFIAFPVVWLRLRAFFTKQLSIARGRRALLIVAGISCLGTVAVETPFLLHLAGTSEWQRLSVLSLGLGIVVVSAILLYQRRRRMPPTNFCFAALSAAYLANAALCLVVYSDAPGPFSSKSGWYFTFAIFWPILAELIWLFFA